MTGLCFLFEGQGSIAYFKDKSSLPASVNKGLYCLHEGQCFCCLLEGQGSIAYLKDNSAFLKKKVLWLS